MDDVLRDLLNQFRGRDGVAWAGSVEDLLFEGERVRRTVEVGDDRVVVTTHRLLAFTPGSDGENYQQVDLPNVADVRAGHEGETNLLRHGARFLLYGGILLAIGVFVDFSSFVPTEGFSGGEGASRLGLGGMLATMNRFLGLLADLDEVARIVGAVLLLFSTFVFGVYLLTRDRVLVVDVAGDENVQVPAGDAGEDRLDAAVDELERVLFEGTTGAADGDDGRTDSSGPDPGRGGSDPLSGR